MVEVVGEDVHGQGGHADVHLNKRTGHDDLSVDPAHLVTDVALLGVRGV